MNDFYGDKERAKDLLLDRICLNCGNALETQGGNIYCNFDRKVHNEIFLGEKYEEEIAKVLKKVDEFHTCPLWMK